MIRTVLNRNLKGHDEAMHSMKLTATLVVLSIMAAPALSYARAGGRSSGSGSSGGTTHSSEGSRGSRTYDNNGYKPMERSTTQPASPGVAPSPGSAATAPAAQPQPSFFQRHPLLS